MEVTRFVVHALALLVLFQIVNVHCCHCGCCSGCAGGYGSYGCGCGGYCGSRSYDGGLKIKLGLGSDSYSRGCGLGCARCGMSDGGLAIKLGLGSDCSTGYGSCKCCC